MPNPILRIAAMAALGAGCFLGGAALAQGAAQLAMLDRLEPGMWELRSRDGAVPERLCIDDGHRLIQIRHPTLACSQFVVEDEPGSVTVHYACAGKGTGRTHIRYETSRLVQIEASGVSGGFPFDITGEARRIGSCAGS